MRIAVYGAGAIGGHLAMRLHKGGADVSVIARGAHLAAIRDRGLTVHAADGHHHARLRATSDPAELGAQTGIIAPDAVTVAALKAAGFAPEILPP